MIVVLNDVDMESESGPENAAATIDSLRERLDLNQSLKGGIGGESAKECLMTLLEDAVQNVRPLC